MPLKVLPLDNAYKTKHFLKEVKQGYHKETDPVFNRNGIYLDGDKCWVEVDGKAFVHNKHCFKSELKALDHRPLRAEERDCLAQLMKLKLACKCQIDLLLQDDICRHDRQIHVSIMLRLNKFKKMNLRK